MGGTLQVLTFDEIAEINRLALADSEGLYVSAGRNLLHPGSLEHVLEEIQGSVFGLDPYPSVFEKAGLLAWRIIVRHVFNDGNKRTGMLACASMLGLNGYSLKIDQVTVEIALRIARGEIGFRDFVIWLRERCSAL